MTTELITSYYQKNLNKKDYIFHSKNEEIIKNLSTYISKICNSNDYNLDIIYDVVPKLLMTLYFSKKIKKKKINLSNFINKYFSIIENDSIQKSILLKNFFNEMSTKLDAISPVTISNVVNLIKLYEYPLNENIDIFKQLFAKTKLSSTSFLRVLDLLKQELPNNYDILLSNLFVNCIDSSSHNKIIIELLNLKLYSILTQFIITNKITIMPNITTENNINLPDIDKKINGYPLIIHMCHKITNFNIPQIDKLLEIICSMKLDTMIDNNILLDYLITKKLPIKYLKSFIIKNKPISNNLFPKFINWFIEQQILTNSNTDSNDLKTIYETLDITLSKEVCDVKIIEKLLDIDVPFNIYKKIINFVKSNLSIFEKLIDPIIEYLMRQILIYNTKIDFEDEIIKTIFSLIPTAISIDFFSSIFEKNHSIITKATIINIFDFIFTNKKSIEKSPDTIEVKNTIVDPIFFKIQINEINEEDKKRLHLAPYDSIRLIRDVTLSYHVNNNLSNSENNNNNNNNNMLFSEDNNDLLSPENDNDLPPLEDDDEDNNITNTKEPPIYDYKRYSDSDDISQKSSNNDDSDFSELEEDINSKSNYDKNKNEIISHELCFEIYTKFEIFDFIEKYVLKSNSILKCKCSILDHLRFLFDDTPSVYSNLKKEEKDKINIYCVGNLNQYDLFNLITKYNLKYENFLVHLIKNKIKIKSKYMVQIFDYLSKNRSIYNLEKMFLIDYIISNFIEIIESLTFTKIKQIYDSISSLGKNMSDIRIEILRFLKNQSINIFPDNYIESLIILNSQNKINGIELLEDFKNIIDNHKKTNDSENKYHINNFKIDLNTSLSVINNMFKNNIAYDNYLNIKRLLSITYLDVINNDTLYVMENINKIKSSTYKDFIQDKINNILINSIMKINVNMFDIYDSYINKKQKILIYNLCNHNKNFIREQIGTSNLARKFFNHNNILETILSINNSDPRDFYKQWKITYFNSPGIDSGALSRDFSVSLIKEILNQEFLYKTNNNTYIFNDIKNAKPNFDIDKNTNSENHIYKIIGKYFMKQVLLDKIPLSITFDVSIVFYLANMCDKKGRLKPIYDYRFLSKILPDNIKRNMGFKSYDNMYFFPQSKMINDIIIINDNYYTIEYCEQVDEKLVTLQHHYLITNDDINQYVSKIIRFDIWYKLHKNLKVYETMKKYLKKLLEHNYKYLTFNMIYDVLNGKHINIEEILSKLKIDNCATKYFTTNINNIYNSPYSLTNQVTIESHEKNPLIKIISISTDEIKNNITYRISSSFRKAVIELCCEYKDFGNNFLEFWYGTIVHCEDTLKPHLIICNMDYNFLNHTQIKVASCFFKIYIPAYSIDNELIDMNDFKDFNFDNENILKSIIKKRLYESVIIGYDMLKSSNIVFTST